MFAAPPTLALPSMENLITLSPHDPPPSSPFPQLGFALVIPEATRASGRCSTCVGATLFSQPTDCRAWAANPTCCQASATNASVWEPVNDSQYLSNVLTAVRSNITVRISAAFCSLATFHRQHSPPVSREAAPRPKFSESPLSRAHRRSTRPASTSWARRPEASWRSASRAITLRSLQVPIHPPLLHHLPPRRCPSNLAPAFRLAWCPHPQEHARRLRPEWSSCAPQA